MDKPRANTNSQDSPQPELGGSHHLPLIVYFVLGHRPTPKCHFVSRLPSGSPEIPGIGTFATLKAHNFMCGPSIEMRFKEKL